MSYLPIYIFYSLGFRIYLFMRHWYYDSFFWSFNLLTYLTFHLDNFFNLLPIIRRFSLAKIFTPTPSKIFINLLGLLLYLFLATTIAVLFIIWSLIPPLIIISSIAEFYNL